MVWLRLRSPPTGQPTKRPRLRTNTTIADSPELEVEAANTRWEWFALHTADSDLKFRLSVALELKSKRTQTARQAVEWGTLRELPDGFVLQWVSPALKRAGHMWWSRIIKKMPCSKTAEWKVKGYHADPGVACPGRSPFLRLWHREQQWYRPPPPRPHCLVLRRSRPSRHRPQVPGRNS